jgi:sulfur-carrier protein adenylyltransferase/sulfurtransferase
VGSFESALYGLEISVEEAGDLFSSDKRKTIIDIRSETAYQLSRINGAHHTTEEKIIPFLSNLTKDKGDPIVIYCAVGIRSTAVAEYLRSQGYLNASSIAGGFTAWRSVGSPVVNDSSFTISQLERYSRNIFLKEIGEAGQLKLMNSKVLLVGAGGLAASAALYLAACGIGTIGIVDFDTVDASNLNRQIIHGIEDVGRLKVESAKSSIEHINPDVTVVSFADRLSQENVNHILNGFDVVMDASDNFGTKYLLNDACFLAGKPYVFGGAVGFDGQAGVFWPHKGGPCLRCLMPEQPDSRASQSCSEAGVLGMVPGLIGLVQATEVVKMMLGIGTVMIGKFYLYDALNLGSRFVETGKRMDCPLCGVNPKITAIYGEGSVEYKGRSCDI